MRSIQYHAYGKPEDVLRVDDVAPPAAPGPDEVRGALDLARTHPHPFDVAARYDLDDARAAAAHAQRAGRRGAVRLTSPAPAATP